MEPFARQVKWVAERQTGENSYVTDIYACPELQGCSSSQISPQKTLYTECPCPVERARALPPDYLIGLMQRVGEREELSATKDS
jgi:hypothetical protein